jgi:hypothetical protein
MVLQSTAEEARSFSSSTGFGRSAAAGNTTVTATLAASSPSAAAPPALAGLFGAARLFRHR